MYQLRLPILIFSLALITVFASLFTQKAFAVGQWVFTDPMHSLHWIPNMTTLQDGRVMVVSGDGHPFVSVTELYNPLTETWELTGNVNQQRDQFDPVTLDNGKVLIAGGQTAFGSGPTASAELYDPSTGVWNFTGSHVIARQAAYYEKLLDGRVLAVGGLGTNTSEIYDPSTEQWTLVGSVNHQRSGNSRNSVVLNDGRVLVMGADSTTNTTELFDPATNSWTSTGNLNVARNEGFLVKLLDGKILLFNGAGDGNFLKDAEIYDPATGTWTVAASSTYARSGPAAVRLPDGRVFVSGGFDGTTPVKQSEIYDPVTDTWTVDATMNYGHHASHMALLATGKILIAGGFGDEETKTAELYTLGTVTPTPTPTPTPTITATPTPLPVPTDKDQCKDDGWKNYPHLSFKNQGNCVSYVTSAK